MTLIELKTYLRIDGTDSDADLTAFMAAAISYVKQQTGKTKIKTGVDVAGLPVYADIATNELYNLAVKLLCAHWYENRCVEAPGQTTRITHSVDALINHIALCGDYI